MNFIGSKLRKLRESKNLTLQDVDELFNISQSTMSDIETNKKQPRKATVDRLCKAFKVDDRYFYIEDADLPWDVIPNMTDDMKLFLLDQDNVPYLIISEKAKRSGLSPSTLEKLIELWTQK